MVQALCVAFQCRVVDHLVVQSGVMLDGYDWWRFVSIETVDWSHNSAEWQAWLGRCLNAGGSLRHEGSKFDDTTRPFLQQRAADCPVHLLVAPLVNGNIAVYLGGVGPLDERSSDAIDAWTLAVQEATRSIGTPGEEFEWSAIIGPPSSRISGGESTIGASTTIGALRLRRSETALVEAFAPSTHPSLNGVSFGLSWPIIVEGRDVGVDWPAASQSAARRLHRLVGLLTLIWQQPIVVREAIAPLSWGVRTVPERLIWQASDHLPPSDAQPPREQPLPSWGETAWVQLGASPRLESATAAYHQGLLAHQEHPSLALVAFIASIEAIASLIFREKRCRECRSVRDVGKTFRSAVALVVDSEEAAELGGAYNARSRTVHQGVLHGSENRRGATAMFDPWQIDGGLRFDWGITWQMQKAARELILMGLRDELPPKGSLPLEGDGPLRDAVPES